MRLSGETRKFVRRTIPPIPRNELLGVIEDLQTRIAKLERRLADAEAAIESIERRTGLKRGEFERTIQGMESNAPGEVKGPGRRPSVDHPFIRALGGKRPTTWAREHGLEPEEVRSWYRTADRRAIPRRYAEMIRDELGVPLSAWKAVK